MNKTMIKILMAILVIALLAVTIVPNIVMATDDQSGTIDELFNQKAEGTDGLKTTGGKIVDVITTVGIVVAVIVLLVLGIKYMMGSASEKAEYKKTMIPYLVGAVLIFGASAIAKAVVSLSAGITGS